MKYTLEKCNRFNPISRNRNKNINVNISCNSNSSMNSRLYLVMHLIHVKDFSVVLIVNDINYFSKSSMIKIDYLKFFL